MYADRPCPIVSEIPPRPSRFLGAAQRTITLDPKKRGRQWGKRMLSSRASSTSWQSGFAGGGRQRWRRCIVRSFRAVHSTAEGGRVAQAARSRAEALSGRDGIVTREDVGNRGAAFRSGASSVLGGPGFSTPAFHWLPHAVDLWGGTATFPSPCGELQVPSHSTSNGRRHGGGIPLLATLYKMSRLVRTCHEEKEERHGESSECSYHQAVS